ncbi:DEAD/DEAH box helicase family protein [Sphingopyxis sp.]|uniref:DEAD/DEAH box helicase family protein n=1 Tax=Sphingopyxis sp. TaxID=1908224 RepID=UPI003D80F8CD
MDEAEATDTLFARMRFSGRWRDYQQRVLDDYEAHFADRRLHLVAAPGSGKTVLGLELVRRIGRRAIVLAPTRIIRDQWSQRLVPLFMAEPPPADALSVDLAFPGTLTTATYQALNAAWASEGGARFAALCAMLGADGPITLVLDEAHHLRREWWSALQALVDALPDARIIALTATPPYDAPHAEWLRYEHMCGPIDIEIGVPELVRRGDLCPHQDHVYFSRADAEALDLLHRRRVAISDLLADLRSDTALLDTIATHPWIADPLAHVEPILEAPEILSAMLIHLAACGQPLPAPPLDLLGIRARDVPAQGGFWVERLLDAMLFYAPDQFADVGDRIRDLRAALHEQGLIEGGAVRLGETRSLFALMAGSRAKLDSIADIAWAEAGDMGSALRMLVLSDHVRGAELPRALRDDYVPAKLGVVPIFGALRRVVPPGQRLGVLTGTLVIIPAEAADSLHAVARRFDLEPSHLAITPLPDCGDFLRVTASGPGAERVVAIMTALFCDGHITMLVGTQALLGEGWDAPALNSLLLASNSAAFMLSNQMRGRAIRIDPARPDKVANIWHLATIDPGAESIAEVWGDHVDWGRIADGDAITSDFDLLERRFRAFEGIANSPSTAIESGVRRLALRPGAGIAASNAATLALARDRAGIAARWQRSLGGADARAHVRETAAPNYAPQRLASIDTLQWLAASALASGAGAAALQLRTIAGAGIAVAGAALAGAATVAMLPRLFLAARLWLRNGSLERSLGQVGKAVLGGLHAAGALSVADHAAATLRIAHDASGRVELVVDGISRSGERMVMMALAELLGPVQNPRYLLERRSWLGPVARRDYHAVPTVIARRQPSAEAFHRLWKAHVGSSDLVFTRTAEGRLILLRARARSFAAGFQRRVDRRSAWL